MQLFAEAREYQSRTKDPVTNALFWGMSALCALKRNSPAEACRGADAALEVLRSNPTWIYGQVLGLSAAMETYFGLLQKSRDEVERISLHESLRQSLAVLQRLVAVIRIGRPEAFLWHGRYAALHGHTRLAQWLLGRARQAAEGFGMPFDQALAEVAQARGDRALAAQESEAVRCGCLDRLGRTGTSQSSLDRCIDKRTAGEVLCAGHDGSRTLG